MIVSIIAIYRVSLKRNIKEKQLEIILDLISKISLTRIDCNFKNGEFQQGTCSFSLIHLYFSNFREKHSELYDINTLYFQNGFQEFFPFFNLIGHPLLPKKIKALLYKFQCASIDIKSSEREIIEKEYIIITNFSEISKLSDHFYKPVKQQTNYETFSEFSVFVADLLQEINKWLKDNDIKNIGFDRKLKLN